MKIAARWLVLLLMLAALVPLTFTVAQAQTAGNGKYDTDGDRLMEITYLEQLDAVRWDQDGNGRADVRRDNDSFAQAFPLEDGERVCDRPCRGYELTRSLDFRNPDHYQSGEVRSTWTGGEGWLPIGVHSDFLTQATIEGNGHTIKELFIYRPARSYVGLFSRTATGSRISNLGLVDVHVSGKDRVGALVGWNRGGAVANSYATGTVIGRDGVGGLVGYNESSVPIERSSAQTAVKGRGYIGGLVGSNSGPVSASFATGDVIASSSIAGGLTGYNSSSLDAVYATGDVQGSHWVGGLVGYSNGTVSVAYATGNVTSGGWDIGGLVGITPDNNSANLRAVYATGNVTATGSSSHAVGGLVGNSSKGSINNSYAIAKVSSAGGSTGGLVGESGYQRVHNSYWDSDILPTGSGYGEGKTTAELQSPMGYTDIYGTWDDGAEGDVWDFGTASQYPALKADMNGDGIATVGEFGIQHQGTPSERPLDPSCTRGSIAVGGLVTGSWMGHCGSVSRSGSHGLYYTLNLASESEVIITLGSEEVDTYLFLQQGSGTSGAVLYKNDDYSGGGSDSRIHETLAAGSYTIEATTYEAGKTGSFTLKVEPGRGTPRQPGSHCLSGVAVDGGAASGSWADDCPSVNKEGSYARYIAFSLSEETELSITLESDDADTYLFLLEGYGASGAVLHKDDDYPGGGTNSQIKETLPAGVYTVEATTYEAETTGGFTLSVDKVEEPEQPGPPGPRPIDPPETGCMQTVEEDGSVSGEWAAGCESENRDGSYARYYSFTLDGSREVTITLERTSGEADTYLYLLSGAGTDGSVLHSNDDDDGGMSRSRIRETLDAGSYTVEATTYDAGQTGSFTLTVSGLGTAATNTDSCLERLTAAGTVSGTWAEGCESETRDGRYARYYSFTLTEEKDVTITLERTSGEADTYLYLRDGEDTRSGAFLYENDDDGGTAKSTVQAEGLPAGSYTVEATTYGAGETGDFTLTVSGL